MDGNIVTNANKSQVSSDVLTSADEAVVRPRSHVPLLVGCFFGGLAFTLLLAMLIWLSIRRSRMRKHIEVKETQSSEPNPPMTNWRNISRLAAPEDPLMSRRGSSRDNILENGATSETCSPMPSPAIERAARVGGEGLHFPAPSYTYHASTDDGHNTVQFQVGQAVSVHRSLSMQRYFQQQRQTQKTHSLPLACSIEPPTFLRSSSGLLSHASTKPAQQSEQQLLPSSPRSHPPSVVRGRQPRPISWDSSGLVGGAQSVHEECDESPSYTARIEQACLYTRPYQMPYQMGATLGDAISGEFGVSSRTASVASSSSPGKQHQQVAHGAACSASRHRSPSHKPIPRVRHASLKGTKSHRSVSLFSNASGSQSMPSSLRKTNSRPSSFLFFQGPPGGSGGDLAPRKSMNINEKGKKRSSALKWAEMEEASLPRPFESVSLSSTFRHDNANALGKEDGSGSVQLPLPIERLQVHSAHLHHIGHSASEPVSMFHRLGDVGLPRNPHRVSSHSVNSLTGQSRTMLRVIGSPLRASMESSSMHRVEQQQRGRLSIDTKLVEAPLSPYTPLY